MTIAAVASERPVAVPHYVPAPEADEDLDYADLAIIDLSKLATPAGKSELAVEVRNAMREQGFCYVVNHGYTSGQTERMFDIADVAFSGVSDEEKRVYEGRMLQTGSYQGFKLRQYWHIDSGVHDQVENYNINRDVTKKEHPQAIRPLLPEIREFSKHNHLNVLHPILRLLALGMGLPEETFVDIHGYGAVGETYSRFMKYYPRSEEEEAKTNNVWLKGHTDFGSITILYSQPVAALQILSPDGKWRWIRHIPNALVINAGDALEYLSGGFYRGTIHRVVQPPPSQRGYTRLGVFYFAMPDDDVKLVPRLSPVNPVWADRKFKDEDAPTMEAHRKGRTSAYGKSELKKSDDGVEEEVINGVLIRHYN
ncbi:Clavaminate synthase-like protein [Cristinia sonorae]|uniref:Clavaminate synthase-like protein n=1 Tax=Cristinia sonorae TaxID=1940300 RepID=A0A8K0UF67_9AGAR|nr:Clavaminate synthase-like protein [Cristinia sonorae]